MCSNAAMWRRKGKGGDTDPPPSPWSRCSATDGDGGGGVYGASDASSSIASNV
jgi:hypothetical protein